MGPAMTADDLSEDDNDSNGRRSRESSMPGSFEEHHSHLRRAMSDQDEERDLEEGRRKGSPSENEDYGAENDDGDSFDDGAIFDDDILAAGEMKHVPF